MTLTIVAMFTALYLFIVPPIIYLLLKSIKQQKSELELIKYIKINEPDYKARHANIQKVIMNHRFMPHSNHKDIDSLIQQYIIPNLMSKHYKELLNYAKVDILKTSPDMFHNTESIDVQLTFFMIPSQQIGDYFR